MRKRLSSSCARAPRATSISCCFRSSACSAYAIDDLLLQDALLDGVERAIAILVARVRELPCVFWSARRSDATSGSTTARWSSRAAALLGITPKSFLPNYRDTTRIAGSRRASASSGAKSRSPADRSVRHGSDFRSIGPCGFRLSRGDLRRLLGAGAAVDHGALAGALILCNLSASNVVDRQGGRPRDAVRLAVDALPGRVCLFGGGSGREHDRSGMGRPGDHSRIGCAARATERFPSQSQMAIADVDVQRIRLERMRTPTFNAAAVAAGHPETTFRRVAFDHAAAPSDVGLVRAVDRFPFVPDDPARLDRDCYEAFNIQVQGLRKRLQATNGERVVIGVSGGLDSTHALIVAAQHVRRAGPSALEHPRLHDAGLCDVRKTKAQCLGADERPRHDGGGDRHQAGRAADARRHRASVRARRSRSTTSRSRTCRRACAPTTCSAWPTSAARSCWERAICRSSRSAGARTASAIT